MAELIEYKLNEDRRKKELSLFLYNVRRSGLYPDMVIDRLEAHIIEGKPESVVDSIFYEEPIFIAEMLTVDRPCKESFDIKMPDVILVRQF